MNWTIHFCLLSIMSQCSLITGEGCPANPSPQNLPPDMPMNIVKAFQQVYDMASSFIDNKTIPGISIGITYNGQTVFNNGAGVKSKEDPNHTPPDINTIFRIGSVSKIFPVTMIYQLYESGLIHSLDDPLSKYAPDFSIVNPYSTSNITIRQMASQLSGLQREAPCNNKGLKICQLSNEEILKILSSEYLIHPPWTKPSYSNLAYALLGRLLVRLVDKDMTFEEYVQTKILSPLGMYDTGFKITETVKSKMAVGYMLDGSIAPLTDIGWEAPAGQMYSSINDLNKLSNFFYEAYFLREGDKLPHTDSILKAVTRREMALPYFVNPDRETGFGTPWEIMYRNNYTIRTKGGNIDGYSALFSFIPELHLGINALFSGGFESSIFAAKAFDILIPPLVSYLSSLQPNLRYPPNPQVYTGTFVGDGVEVTIFSQGHFQPLYVRASNRTERLDYFGKDKMQIYFDESLSPCMDNELLGSLGEWIVYDSNYENSKSPGFTIPGQFPGIYFKRIS